MIRLAVAHHCTRSGGKEEVLLINSVTMEKINLVRHFEIIIPEKINLVRLFEILIPEKINLVRHFEILVPEKINLVKDIMK